MYTSKVNWTAWTLHENCRKFAVNKPVYQGLSCRKLPAKKSQPDRQFWWAKYKNKFSELTQKLSSGNQEGKMSSTCFVYEITAAAIETFSLKVETKFFQLLMWCGVVWCALVRHNTKASNNNHKSWMAAPTNILKTWNRHREDLNDGLHVQARRWHGSVAVLPNYINVCKSTRIVVRPCSGQRPPRSRHRRISWRNGCYAALSRCYGRWGTNSE